MYPIMFPSGDQGHSLDLQLICDTTWRTSYTSNNEEAEHSFSEDSSLKRTICWMMVMVRRSALEWHIDSFIVTAYMKEFTNWMPLCIAENLHSNIRFILFWKWNNLKIHSKSPRKPTSCPLQRAGGLCSKTFHTNMHNSWISYYYPSSFHWQFTSHARKLIKSQ